MCVFDALVGDRQDSQSMRSLIPYSSLLETMALEIAQARKPPPQTNIPPMLNSLDFSQFTSLLWVFWGFWAESEAIKLNP
ncbi:MAG TPA: hypothetical protein IGS40_25720 [Trichormus sp. M33_DOE_039]|nr:hypothetical protein [Trichormus sp. M33_DOE_039]